MAAKIIADIELPEGLVTMEMVQSYRHAHSQILDLLVENENRVRAMKDALRNAPFTQIERFRALFPVDSAVYADLSGIIIAKKMAVGEPL